MCNFLRNINFSKAGTKNWKAEKLKTEKLETKIKISIFQKKLETKSVNFSKNQKLEN